MFPCFEHPVYSSIHSCTNYRFPFIRASIIGLCVEVARSMFGLHIHESMDGHGSGRIAMLFSKHVSSFEGHIAVERSSVERIDQAASWRGSAV